GLDEEAEREKDKVHHQRRHRDPAFLYLPRPPGARSRRRDRLPGGASVHPGDPAGHVPQQIVDDAPVRGLLIREGDHPSAQVPPGAWTDRSFGCLRPPHADGFRFGSSDGEGGSGESRRGDRLARRHGGAAGGNPARQGLDFHDDQRHGGDPPVPLRGGREEDRHCAGEALRHRAERRLEGVHGPRHLHLSSARLAADRNRSVRLLQGASAPLEQHQHQRLSHPRGGSHRGPGDRLHARERPGIPALRPERGIEDRGGRPAHFLLLQLPQRPVRRGGQVPRGATALGAGGAGVESEALPPRISFFFNAHNDLFEEVAKFRAARRLWAQLVRERFQVEDPRALMLRFHAQTAGSSLTAPPVEQNVVRVTYQALSAILGGAQSLHTNSMDEALSLPTEESVAVALRTQQILAHETGVADTVDPLGGSYYVESLTNRLEKGARDYLDRIDRMGGVIPALEEGFITREIQESAYRAQKAVESGEQGVVGVNRYRSEKERPPRIHKGDPALEKA